MPFFRKKPVVIEAVQYTGSNTAEVAVFGGADLEEADRMVIHTLEGDMLAAPGDWIIRGVSGECYPCKPDAFTKTYEPAAAAPPAAEEEPYSTTCAWPGCSAPATCHSYGRGGHHRCSLHDPHTGAKSPRETGKGEP